MIKHSFLPLFLILLFQFFTQQSLATGEILVKADSVTISGYSAISTDKATIYGGIAGTACTGDGISTCNSCTDTSGGVNACNQASIYPAMHFTVNFKVTKTVTGVAKLFVGDSTSGDLGTAVVSLASTSYTADTSTITLQTTWGDICSAAGLGTNCAGTSGTSFLSTKSIRFGVDSDNSGDVEDAERKAVTLKLHYIPAAATDVTQAFCSGSAAGAGFCQISFLPGDEKIYIDSATYNGDDAGFVSWESIALFPVPVTAGGEAGVYTSFFNSAVTPIFVTISATDGSIPDSQVRGSITNYQKYCIVYATKNQAQNIYKFVTTGVDTSQSCVTPADVVGMLDDKSCFISTAAFGSQLAPEVDTFRKFRNEFLVPNFLGRSFVKLYYFVSPPIAKVISENYYLKIATRALLYPFLFFAIVSLKIGLLMTLMLLSILVYILIKMFGFFKSNNIVFLVFILISVSSLKVKAEVIPSEVEISHPLAQEGLVRIKTDGTYIYDSERPLKKESGRLTFGQANHPDIILIIQPVDQNNNPTGAEKTFNFSDLYDESSGLILGYDYEWFTNINKGKLGIQGGISLMFVSGHGRLASDPNDPSVEGFTFLTMPLSLGGVYRFEYKDKQLFAPYVSGGGTVVVLAEKRDDLPAPKVIAGLGFYAAGGILFNVSSLDRDAGYQLESEYGISNMWLSLEFRMVEASNSAFSFSNKYVNAGLSIDF